MLTENIIRTGSSKSYREAAQSALLLDAAHEHIRHKGEVILDHVETTLFERLVGLSVF